MSFTQWHYGEASYLTNFNPIAPGRYGNCFIDVILKLNSVFNMLRTSFTLPLCSYHRASLMDSQHCFRKWLGDIWQQVISWIKHDDVIKWRHFPRYWPFVRRIHRSPVNSPHKGQWRGALMFTLICARIKGWVNNCEAGDLRRNRAHCDVIVMKLT